MDYVEKNKNNSCSIVHARINVTRISSSFYIRFDRFIPYKYVNLFSFAPRCLKKRGSYISSMNVNEEIFGDESAWISRRGGGKRKTFPRFFFSFSFRTRSPDGIPGRSEAKLPGSTTGFSPFRPPIRDPPIRYCRSEHPLHSPARNRRERTLRGDKRLRSGVDPRIHLRFFYRPPRYLPFFTTPPPSPCLSPRAPRVALGNFISYRPRRDSPILIKRISRHQFRVPWSPRDINYGRAIYPRDAQVMDVRLNIVNTISETIVATVVMFFSLFFSFFMAATDPPPDRYPIEVEGVFQVFIGGI